MPPQPKEPPTGDNHQLPVASLPPGPILVSQSGAAWRTACHAVRPSLCALCALPSTLQISYSIPTLTPPSRHHIPILQRPGLSSELNRPPRGTRLVRSKSRVNSCWNLCVFPPRHRFPNGKVAGVGMTGTVSSSSPARVCVCGGTTFRARTTLDSEITSFLLFGVKICFMESELFDGEGFPFQECLFDYMRSCSLQFSFVNFTGAQKPEVCTSCTPYPAPSPAPLTPEEGGSTQVMKRSV